MSEENNGVYIYGLVLSKHGTILDQSPMYGPFTGIRLVGLTLLGDDEDLFYYDYRTHRWRLSDGSDWGFTNIHMVNEKGLEVVSGN